MSGHFGTSTEVSKDTSVLMPKCPETFRYWCRSVRRHFGTGAELVRTLRTQNAGAEMV